MSIVGPDGQAVAPEKPREGTAKPEEPSQEDVLSKPLIGIDAIGNLTLHIPLHKTNEIFARGFVDLCRSQVLTWYANRQREAAQVQAMAPKGGFKNFVNGILRRK